MSKMSGLTSDPEISGIVLVPGSCSYTVISPISRWSTIIKGPLELLERLLLVFQVLQHGLSLLLMGHHIYLRLFCRSPRGLKINPGPNSPNKQEPMIP